MYHRWQLLPHSIAKTSLKSIAEIKCPNFPFFKVLIWERERKTPVCCLALHVFIGDSRMCPDLGWNLRPWHIGMTLPPTELPGQDNANFCTCSSASILYLKKSPNFLSSFYRLLQIPFQPPYTNSGSKSQLCVLPFSKDSGGGKPHEDCVVVGTFTI